ncbi:hypothetical protein LSH36_79g05005 [Paralvinella palmiformis]|uniref:Protein kinase domain-containing protein n=1 Tax=Paralvinella palmiformis TaxID=53620 RepID=A0AAD9NAU1_9ANNE|nr:hypothetical protein LSH36_79g05005 [Paralvinella palmiformis]
MWWVKESIRDRQFTEFYDIGKELGSGATSQVFKCQHKGTGKEWAVKMIEKTGNLKKAVNTEIGILLKISHPNIIRLKEVYETPTSMQLVLELVTGGELFDRIVTQGYYSEKDAAKCVNEMLQALKYLHEHDIIHRDLKDLIQKLLVLDPERRLTAVQALHHPWVRGDAVKGVHMENTQTALKQLNTKRKMRMAMNVMNIVRALTISADTEETKKE